MSIPKITPRPRRAIRVENDPYHMNYFIRRTTYEDGTVELFAGDYRVRSVRYHPHYPMRRSYALLDLADDRTFRLEGVSPQENDWLLGQKEETI